MHKVHSTEPAQSYVALGDSISIDEYAGGPGRGAASLLVRNRDEDFPEWRGRDLASLGATDAHVLAADGATCRDVLDRQLPRLARLGGAPDLVTLTVGGNDVLSCYGDTRRALEVVSAGRSDVGLILKRLAPLVSPDSAVLVGTVYDPSDGTGDAARVGLPEWPGVVEVLARLNEALHAVAAEHSARVADIHGLFLGDGLSRGNPAQSDPRPPDRELWYCDVIEPNAWGASGVREAFWNALDWL